MFKFLTEINTHSNNSRKNAHMPKFITGILLFPIPCKMLVERLSKLKYTILKAFILIKFSSTSISCTTLPPSPPEYKNETISLAKKAYANAQAMQISQTSLMLSETFCSPTRWLSASSFMLGTSATPMLVATTVGMLTSDETMPSSSPNKVHAIVPLRPLLTKSGTTITLSIAPVSGIMHAWRETKNANLNKRQTIVFGDGFLLSPAHKNIFFLNILLFAGKISSFFLTFASMQNLFVSFRLEKYTTPNSKNENNSETVTPSTAPATE